MKILLFLVSMALTPLAIALDTDKLAPNFKIGEISLSDFKGKVVVLEWLNHGCPFVKKHYSSGNMQSVQKKYVEKNVVWLSIISSAPGKQGHVTPTQALSEKKEHGSAATHILLDPEGKVGKLYGAKTTPHMFIIDPKGLLVYQGALDDKPDTNTASIESATNFVIAALDEILDGKKVSVASTKAYGCSVKYAE